MDLEIEKFGFIYKLNTKKIKKWFLELDDFDKIFEKKVNEINDFNKEKTKNLVIRFNQMSEIFLTYLEIKKYLFDDKKSNILNNNYIKLLEKTVYIIDTKKGVFKLKPIMIDDRSANFEILFPKEYKGKYIYLRPLPVFILAMTSMRPYFNDGRLTKFGKVELKAVIEDKYFKDEPSFRTNLIATTKDDTSDYKIFKNLYKKVFETNNNIDFKKLNKKEKKYLHIIKQFYNTYCNMVASEYKEILDSKLLKLEPSTYNILNKKVHTVKELSIDYKSIFDEFTSFFITRFVEEFTPHHSLAIPRGSFNINKDTTIAIE